MSCADMHTDGVSVGAQNFEPLHRNQCRNDSSAIPARLAGRFAQRHGGDKAEAAEQQQAGRFPLTA